MENIEIRLMTHRDAQPVTDFLKRQLPINGSPPMQILGLPPEGVDYIARRKVHDALKDPEKIMSHVAMDKSKGIIIGCVVRYFVYPNAQQEDDSFVACPIDPKTQHMIDMNAMMWSGVEEFLQPEHANMYLRDELAVIDPAYRKLGLLKKMLGMWNERCWKVFGCRYVIGNATNYITQEFSERSGWVTLRWIKWRDYYMNGKIVFDYGPGSKQKYAKLIMLDIKADLEKRMNMASKL